MINRTLTLAFGAAVTLGAADATASCITRRDGPPICDSTPQRSYSSGGGSTTTYRSSGGVSAGAVGAAAGLAGIGLGLIGGLLNSVEGSAQAAESRNDATTNEIQARALYDRGQAQLASGNCTGAAASFDQAYDMSHDGDYYINYGKWRDVAQAKCAGANATAAAAEVLNIKPVDYAPVPYTPSSPVPYELSPQGYQPTTAAELNKQQLQGNAPPPMAVAARSAPVASQQTPNPCQLPAGSYITVRKANGRDSMSLGGPDYAIENSCKAAVVYVDYVISVYGSCQQSTTRGSAIHSNLGGNLVASYCNAPPQIINARFTK